MSGVRILTVAETEGEARLDRWLRRHRDVLAFCSARPVDGGTGAVYVLLRRK